MKKIYPILNITLILIMLMGLFTSSPVLTVLAASIQPADTKGVSPESFIGQDGSLQLDGNYHGSFDLSGWDVTLDPVRGPLFAPMAAIGDWSTVGVSSSPVTNSIYSILVNGADVYIGGDFKDVAGINEADYIARWDGLNWYALGSNGAGDGSVSATVKSMVMVGNNLYVGGYFNVNNNGTALTGANYLARWNGTNWAAVDGSSTSAINGWVHALTVRGSMPNTYLYVGGEFSDAAGLSAADYIARINLDTNTWSALGNDGASGGSLNSTVYAIATDSAGAVYAGGFFTNVKNGASTLDEADYVAKWDGVNWSALGNNGSGVGAFNAIVGDIVVDGSNNVYVGGGFNDAAGIAAADYVAKWNGSSWAALGNNGSGNGALISYNPNGTVVQHLLLAGSDLYAGGYLKLSANNAGTYAAKYDTNTDTWTALGSDGSGGGALNQAVFAFAYSASNLYVGGDFYQVNNGGAILNNANKLAIYSGGNWSGVNGNSASLNNSVYAVAVDGTDVYVGGIFTDLNGNKNMDCIIKWNGTAWLPLGNELMSYGSISNGGVQTITINGDDVYVGGFFQNVNNSGTFISTADRIAKWNKTTMLWSALGSNGSGNGAIGNGYVYAIAVSGSNVYAGGSFVDAAGNTTADYVAKYDNTNASWSALGSNNSSNGSLNNTVRALAVGSGGDLFAGGSFQDVNNNGSVLTAADYIAKWDGADWSALGGPSAPLNSNVYALTYAGSDLYVGGHFDNANGVSTADRLAKYTPGTGIWSGIGGSDPTPALNGDVYAIHVDGTDIYIGGAFTNLYHNAANIPEADYVAKWNGANWSALGSNNGGNGSLSFYVNALAKSSGDLFVGGDFKNVNNNGVVLKNADYIAAFGVSGALDTNPPTVISIARASADPSSAASVDFTVSFSETVTGVGTQDFTLATTGVVGANISSMTGSGALYTVTVITGSQDGTLRLDVVDDDSIKDAADNPLGGTGIDNGNFTDGEVYTIEKGLTTPPSVPVLTSPAKNFLTKDYTPKLDWKNSTLPSGVIFDHYQIQVATDAAFSNLVVDVAISGITNSEYTPGSDLTPNTKHYWRVRAVNATGGFSNWSSAWTFRTALTPPVLVSPANAFNALTLRPTFDWDDVAGATGYTIQVSKNNTFTQVVNTGNPVTSTYTANLPKNLTLYWRVKTKGANGPSAWSEVRNFNSANSPGTPTLSLPANNFLDKTYLPLFKWSVVTLPAGTTFKHYQLQVDDHADFASPVIDDTTIIDRLTNQFQVVAPLAHNTKFYWRVRAVNTDDEVGNWSVVRTLRAIVDAPVLLSPADGSPAGTLKPVFDWEDASGPGTITNYTIQISTSPAFGSFLLNKNVASSTYTMPVNLPAGKTLYWRVRVNGANGPSAWTVFSFSTP